MSELEGYSPEEQRLLAGLLYRTGIWMSNTDDVEGELDDEREMQALEHILTALAGASEGGNSAFIQALARSALDSRDRWEEWAARSFDILGDCEKAIGLIKQHGNATNLRNYKATLMEIATIVAQAHGEFGDFDDEEEEGFGAKLGKFIGKFAGKSQDDADHPMNVSPAEDSALSRLSMALQVKERS